MENNKTSGQTKPETNSQQPGQSYAIEDELSDDALDDVSGGLTSKTPSEVIKIPTPPHPVPIPYPNVS